MLTIFTIFIYELVAEITIGKRSPPSNLTTGQSEPLGCRVFQDLEWNEI